jgi:hypothetical protein
VTELSEKNGKERSKKNALLCGDNVVDTFMQLRLDLAMVLGRLRQGQDERTSRLYTWKSVTIPDGPKYQVLYSHVSSGDKSTIIEFV